jgi:hypothetical protein
LVEELGGVRAERFQEWEARRKTTTYLTSYSYKVLLNLRKMKVCLRLRGITLQLVVVFLSIAAYFDH